MEGKLVVWKAELRILTRWTKEKDKVEEMWERAELK